MTKQKVKDWKELIRDMQKVDAMRCKPDFTRLSNNFITDEDKSVKWNREQVEKNHTDYDKEVSRLNTEKTKNAIKLCGMFIKKSNRNSRD